MSVVAKKKPAPAPSGDPGPEPGAVLLRVPDARLLEVLEAYATETRRSRNMAIVTILEEAMKVTGRWPPPPAPADRPAKEKE